MLLLELAACASVADGAGGRGHQVSPETTSQGHGRSSSQRRPQQQLVPAICLGPALNRCVLPSARILGSFVPQRCGIVFCCDDIFATMQLLRRSVDAAALVTYCDDVVHCAVVVLQRGRCACTRLKARPCRRKRLWCSKTSTSSTLHRHCTSQSESSICLLLCSFLSAL